MKRKFIICPRKCNRRKEKGKLVIYSFAKLTVIDHPRDHFKLCVELIRQSELWYKILLLQAAEKM